MNTSSPWNVELAREYLTDLSTELKDNALLEREEMLRLLMAQGEDIPRSPTNPDPNHMVNGCQSQVFIFLTKQADKLEFSGASDSLMLKGFLGILFKAMNGLTCSEVTELWVDLEHFLESSGIPSSLTPNRKQGLSYILNFARALQEKEC